MHEDSAAVLVVGGGLVGLTTAMLLAAVDVEVVVAERQLATSVHPRARGLNPRAMEIFRSAGVAERVHAAGAGYIGFRRRARVESLYGRELHRFDLPASEDLSAISPEQWCVSDQDRIDPLVRDRALELGARVLFGTEVTGFEQDESGVTAELVDHRSGSSSRLRCDHLVAADGAGSAVRAALGVGRQGPGVLGHQISVRFSADLADALGDRRYSVCQVQGPRVQGILTHDDTLQRGALYLRYQPEAGESVTDFNPQRCIELIRAAVGDDDLVVEVIDVLPWTMAALVAERYRAGRVFLAGDAAHVMPPIGGFGASTGIQDAHNLAWKLALASRGLATEELLESYEQERRPIAQMTVEQGVRRLTAATGPAPARTGSSDLLDDLALIFGYRYGVAGRLPAVGHDGDMAVVAPHELTAEPGTRAPHSTLLEPDGSILSTLDLFAREFVLLTGPAAGGWAQAGQAVAARGVALRCYVLDSADRPEAQGSLIDPDNRCASAYRLLNGGAVLVRPDGFVAYRWESAVTDPAHQLMSVLQRLTGRSPAVGVADSARF